VNGKNLKDSIITDAWGFSDGNRLFIRYGGNFYPLYRTGDNFEFFAEDNSQQIPSPPYTPGKPLPAPLTSRIDKAIEKLVGRPKEYDLLHFYLLDMESGRITRPYNSH
jgi:hypothetical protein